MGLPNIHAAPAALPPRWLSLYLKDEIARTWCGDDGVLLPLASVMVLIALIYESGKMLDHLLCRWLV